MVQQKTPDRCQPRVAGAMVYDLFLVVLLRKKVVRPGPDEQGNNERHYLDDRLLSLARDQRRKSIALDRKLDADKHQRND